MFNRVKFATSTVLCSVLLSGAAAGCSFSMPSFKIPRVFKVTVQQGNVITQEMIDQLKPGMSRSQVAYIMGEPVMRNTFDPNRWNYVYTIVLPGYFSQRVKMALYFEEDVLSYFTGDLAPTSAADEQTPQESETANEEAVDTDADAAEATS